MNLGASTQTTGGPDPDSFNIPESMDILSAFASSSSNLKRPYKLLPEITTSALARFYWAKDVESTIAAPSFFFYHCSLAI